MSSTSGAEHAGLLSVDERTRKLLAKRLEASSPRRRGWVVRRALVAGDVVGLLTAFGFSTMTFTEDGLGRLHRVEELLLFCLLLPLWILLAKLHGLYDRDEERTNHSTVDDITGVFNVVTIGTWIFFLTATASGTLAPTLERTTAFWLAAIVAVPVARAATRSICRRSDAYLQNTIVIGTGPVGRELARKILSHPEYGLNLVGFVDATPASTSGTIGPTPILGAPTDLPALVHALDIERVIVSFTDDGPERTLALIRDLRDLELQIDIVPRLYEAVGTSSSVHMIEGLPLVGLPPIRLSSSSRFLKRSLDIAGALVGLVVLSPLMLAAAVAIKLDSRGPILFRQTRRGEWGRTFQILKFRTMSTDAEERKSDVAHLNMHSDADPRMFKIPSDPRVTRVGAFLRRTSIDEVPQLINVLRGEMSLVGPRPLILEEDEHVLDWARKRLELKPGITGIWQVLGRSDIPFGEMTKLDYLYVTNWSLKEDIRLILLTLPSLVRQRNAY